MVSPVSHRARMLHRQHQPQYFGAFWFAESPGSSANEYENDSDEDDDDIDDQRDPIQLLLGDISNHRNFHPPSTREDMSSRSGHYSLYQPHHPSLSPHQHQQQFSHATTQPLHSTRHFPLPQQHHHQQQLVPMPMEPQQSWGFDVDSNNDLRFVSPTFPSPHESQGRDLAAGAHGDTAFDNSNNSRRYSNGNSGWSNSLSSATSSLHPAADPTSSNATEIMDDDSAQEDISFEKNPHGGEFLSYGAQEATEGPFLAWNADAASAMYRPARVITETLLSYSLADLWAFYDQPYGVELPVIYNGKEEQIYFVPHISAIQLWVHCTPEEQQQQQQQQQHHHHHDGYSFSEYGNASYRPASPTSSYTSMRFPSNDNTTSQSRWHHPGPSSYPTQQQPQQQQQQQQSAYFQPYGMNYPNGAQSSFSTNGTIPPPEAHFGSYFPDDQSSADGSRSVSGSRLAFEFFEDALPDQRLPLIDKIRELATQYPPLLNGQSADFHEKSWFSVIWFPILCHNNTMNMLRGQIITFHRIHHSDSFVDNLFCAPPFAVPPQPTPPSQATQFSSPDTLQASNGNAGTAIQDFERHQSQQPPQPQQQYVEYVFASTCGLVPYKVRNDAWFMPCQVPSQRGPTRMFLGPVHLLRAASNLLEYVGANHPDFEHCVALCPELKALQEFSV